MSSHGTTWNPQRLLRVEESYDTSTGTTKIKTDATYGYLKALGNRQGPHALVSDFVGTSLAKHFGLETADFAIFSLTQDSCFPLPRGNYTQPGPAFISRHVKGRTWGGAVSELTGLQNPLDITRLIVFDTWLLNSDRHPPDLATRKPNYANVYLADGKKPTQPRLLAIDHTHCFDSACNLTKKLANIEKWKDERTYGFFDGFAPFIDPAELNECKLDLRKLQADTVKGILSRLPIEWEMGSEVINSLLQLIMQRAAYLADRIDGGWRIAK